MQYSAGQEQLTPIPPRTASAYRVVTSKPFTVSALYETRMTAYEWDAIFCGTLGPPLRSQASMALRELREDMATAQTMAAVGERTLEHVQRVCPMSGLSIFPLWPVPSPEGGFQWSERLSPEAMRRDMLEGADMFERRFDVLGRYLLRGRAQAVDLNRAFEPEGLVRSEVYEAWSERRFERQMLGLVGAAGRPIGLLCFVRSARELRFEPQDLALLSAACRTIADRTRGVLQPPRPWLDLIGVLAAVAAVPIEAAVFDDIGQMLWMSDEAVIRHEVRAAPGAHRGVLLALPPGLRAWRAAALTALGQADGASARVTLALAQPGAEPAQVEVRTFPDGGGTRRLAIVIASNTMRTGASSIEAPRSPPRCLTVRQGEVALLAAEGHSVLNIAARTGMSVHTVRTHMKAAYKRLGVSNRAELVVRVMGGKG